MRAEGPKERPTAVLCVQLSARYVQIRQTAKNTTPYIADITLLRIHAARATDTGTREIEGERYRDRDVELF